MLECKTVTHLTLRCNLFLTDCKQVTLYSKNNVSRLVFWLTVVENLRALIVGKSTFDHYCCLFSFLHWSHNTSTSLTNKRLEEIEKRFVMLYKLKSSPEFSFKSIQYFLYKYFLHYLNELLPFKIKRDGQFLTSVKKFSFLPFCKVLSRF